ncbi:hypothetical protein BABINDRAFT_96387 [Babjeviella inositovora NRRL Y-12698]|uniref:Uncharacterized protein n=1 Tax=Babjeviella inositovora NRRL Y-12698 TaxID=984486 RepID=A0A1E3QJF9_9ASCO|nr:uncharacterized protein BABINDRAFT_96387 [Babjeviella inositovora NRRL Y-12698]ODQ77594.1 hypothetical protein BABINDRAFT_96387 [Babjeviella inositovora NRRL Y-12698]
MPYGNIWPADLGDVARVVWMVRYFSGERLQRIRADWTASSVYLIRMQVFCIRHSGIAGYVPPRETSSISKPRNIYWAMNLRYIPGKRMDQNAGKFQTSGTISLGGITIV